MDYLCTCDCHRGP